jgi:hypothetical protein
MQLRCLSTKLIASLALVLALSGCSSSPSIDELESRVKLLEYENCLEVQREYWRNKTNDPSKIEEYSLGNCSSIRP